MSAEAHDTPTQRATINQLNVEELDKMLDALRSRRLERVRQLEAAAKVKSDEAQLTSWLKFERAYKIAARYMTKCEAMEDRAEELIRKLRLAVMVIKFEVGNEDAAD